MPPGLALGFAAYRGKTTRILLAGGLSFSYRVQESALQRGLGTSEYELVREDVEQIAFAVPASLTLEQFFTPRISVVLGAESAIFSYYLAAGGEREPGHDDGHVPRLQPAQRVDLLLHRLTCSC